VNVRVDYARQREESPRVDLTPGGGCARFDERAYPAFAYEDVALICAI